MTSLCLEFLFLYETPGKKHSVFQGPFEDDSPFPKGFLCTDVGYVKIDRLDALTNLQGIWIKIPVLPLVKRISYLKKGISNMNHLNK